MDTFRTTYRELSDAEKATMNDIKVVADSLFSAMSSVPDSRYKSLAVTALEQAVMWAVKGITG